MSVCVRPLTITFVMRVWRRLPGRAGNAVCGTHLQVAPSDKIGRSDTGEGCEDTCGGLQCGHFLPLCVPCANEESSSRQYRLILYNCVLIEAVSLPFSTHPEVLHQRRQAAAGRQARHVDRCTAR